MEQIMTVVIELVMLTVALLVGRFIIPVLRTHLDFEKIKMITYYADTFVRAAEQIITGKGQGAAKQDFVLDALESACKNHNINIDRSTLIMFLEDAVNTMNLEADLASK